MASQVFGELILEPTRAQREHVQTIGPGAVGQKRIDNAYDSWPVHPIGADDDVRWCLHIAVVTFFKRGLADTR